MIYSYVQPCPSQTFLTVVLGEKIPILHQTSSFHFIPTRVTDQFFRPASFSQASSLEEGKGRMVFKLITPSPSLWHGEERRCSPVEWVTPAWSWRMGEMKSRCCNSSGGRRVDKKPEDRTAAQLSVQPDVWQTSFLSYNHLLYLLIPFLLWRQPIIRISRNPQICVHLGNRKGTLLHADFMTQLNCTDKVWVLLDIIQIY